LHPSIARLPSQRDAALAFAQVATFVDRIREHGPERALRRVVESIRAGSDARAAFGTAAGRPFSALEREWRASLATVPTPGDAAPRIRPLRFRTDEGDPRAEESSAIEIERARSHLRLGDLLWNRRRPRAAAEEYRRALDAAPDDPVIASRLAQAALTAGDAQRVIDTLARSRERYRDHEPTRALLAGAYRLLGNESEAIWEATEAIALNPFDPAPHCDLAAIVEDPGERARETSLCASLGGGP
jgi:tetratricopeptide (TPR) repeat protein